jgi:hypothetical protein
MSMERPKDLAPQEYMGVNYWMWQVDADDPDFWMGQVGGVSVAADREEVEQTIKGAIRDILP